VWPNHPQIKVASETPLGSQRARGLSDPHTKGTPVPWYKSPPPCRFYPKPRIASLPLGERVSTGRRFLKTDPPMGPWTLKGFNLKRWKICPTPRFQPPGALALSNKCEIHHTFCPLKGFRGPFKAPQGTLCPRALVVLKFKLSPTE